MSVQAQTLSALAVTLVLPPARCRWVPPHPSPTLNKVRVIVRSNVTSLSLGIIITGGSGDYYHGTGVSVEVLRANGSSWCSLPDMPQDRQEHTQSGLVACGGFDHSSRASCVTFANGSWIQSHHLQEERADHTSWVSPSGLVLMGGQFSSYNTELLSDITGDSAEHFPLRYETK